MVSSTSEKINLWLRKCKLYFIIFVTPNLCLLCGEGVGELILEYGKFCLSCYVTICYTNTTDSSRSYYRQVRSVFHLQPSKLKLQLLYSGCFLKHNDMRARARTSNLNIPGTFFLKFLRFQVFCFFFTRM